MFKKIIIKKDFSECWVSITSELPNIKKGVIVIETNDIGITKKDEKGLVIFLNRKEKTLEIKNDEKSFIKVYQK